MDNILENARKNIRPDMGIIKDVDIMVEKINLLLKKNSIAAECVKGGSIAKETFLKDDYDIDLFVRYDQSYREQNISDMTGEMLKELCKDLKVKNLEKIHGSRDYFQFKVKDKSKMLDFEIVPVMLVHRTNYQDASNITDLTPEHVTWVKKYTEKNPNLIDDIRLAKQFCKANRVYGAESYINGFSGHILDILVIYHGSFINMLKAFSRYEDKNIGTDTPIIIDPERHHKDPIKELNQSRIAPLIIIDPIQKNRNSAAALSREKLLIFIDAARKFLKRPDKIYFEIKKFDMKKEIEDSSKGLSKMDSQLIQIRIKTLDGSKDVVGTKVLKAYEAMIDHLRLNGFKVHSSGWDFAFEKRSAEMYIIVDKYISKEVEQEGPPISARKDYQKFLDKHTELKHRTFVRDGRIYVIVPRLYTDAKKFLEDLSKQEFISRRFKSIMIR